MPRVSVIIPVYNSEKFIRETIQSVLDQTYNDYEIIVIDDGSTDQSSVILDSFKDKIRYFYHKNQGLSLSRNFALKQAQGEFIAFLDHDDLWLPEKLEAQISFLDNHKDVSMVFTDSYIINEKGAIYGTLFKGIIIPEGYIFEQLFLFDFIPLLSVLLRKSVLNNCGDFLPNLTIAEDYELFLRISKQNRISLINVPLVKYRMHSSNVSRDVEKANREVLSVIKDVYEKNKEVLESKIGNKAKKRVARVYTDLGVVLLEKNKKTEALEKFKNAFAYDKKSFYVHVLIFVASVPFLDHRFFVKILKFLIKSRLYLKGRHKLSHNV